MKICKKRRQNLLDEKFLPHWVHLFEYTIIIFELFKKIALFPSFCWCMYVTMKVLGRVLVNCRWVKLRVSYGICLQHTLTRTLKLHKYVYQTFCKHTCKREQTYVTLQSLLIFTSDALHAADSHTCEIPHLWLILHVYVYTNLKTYKHSLVHLTRNNQATSVTTIVAGNPLGKGQRTQNGKVAKAAASVDGKCRL